jgi:chemotaxis protein methyltransferase CheR
VSLDAADFALVAKVVYERSGIALEAGKEYLVEARLTTLARQEGLGSLAAVAQQLRARPTGPLTQKIVEAMTTNETLWFRDVRPFDVLKSDVVPALIAARKATKKLVVWSAAASTGQEAYSIAILLRENFPELSSWQVQIIGSDISTEVLEKARQGRYSQLEVNRGLPAALLVKYFERDGMHWRVNQQLRSLVQFTPFNLVSPTWSGVPKPDIVFLRNVMIYFDVPTRRAILKRMGALMAPDGYLFLGAGETTLDIDDAWTRVELGRAHCFRRTSARLSPSLTKEDQWNRRSTTSSH